MKKILLWLFLLLLLIIFCVWIKIDSIYASSKSQIETTKPAVIVAKRYINYDIIQEDDINYTLNGNFKSTTQLESLAFIFKQANKKLLKKNTSIDDALLGEPVLILTAKILPHFMAHYIEGGINYSNQKLKIFGTAKSYEAQQQMQSLLSISSISSQDNSNVIVSKPITYSIHKTHKKLHVAGIFNDNKQLNSIKSILPIHVTTDMKVVPYHKDNGSLLVVKQILPTFLEKYKNGKIEYIDEKLTISGVVHFEADLKEMNNLLNNSNIPIENNTIVKVIKTYPITYAINKTADTLHLNGTFKDQTQIDSITILLPSHATTDMLIAPQHKDNGSLLVVKKILPIFINKYIDGKIIYINEKMTIFGTIKSKSDLIEISNLLDGSNILVLNYTIIDPTIQETKRKFKEEVQKRIANLFQVDNIEFNINNSTLTNKGQNTVTKLAKILKEYTSVHVEIAGHTDSDGSIELNQRLSQARVDMVKTKLIEQEISESRLTAKGYGENVPLVANTTRENKAKNRRVEINILGE